MANEITEFGQIVTYGGAQLTLLGSALAANVNSILIRQGSGTARGWKQFDPSKADFLNSYKILNPGDVVLVNAKTLPMDFPLAAAGTDAPETMPLSASDTGPVSESEQEIKLSKAFTPSVAFSTGAGTVELYINGTWLTLAQAGTVVASTLFKVRVQHTAPFSATLTFTF